MITDLELINKLLIEEFFNFPNHRIFYHEDQLAGKNIVVLENEKWKRIRSIMSPVFGVTKLKKMKPAFDDCVETLLLNFHDLTKNQNISLDQNSFSDQNSFADENSLSRENSNGVVIEAKDYFGAFSIDVICSVVFSTKIDSINNPNHVLVTSIKSFFGHDITLNKLIIFFFPTLMRLFDLYLFNYDVLIFLNNFTSSILKGRENQKEKAKDFIQLLEDAVNPVDGSRLSEEEIADQVILFLVAGYDTSAATLSSIAYCLALNQEVQEKLFQEVDNLQQLKGSNDFTFEELDSLKYLDAVINETLRFLPIVPRIERRSNKNCRFGELFIPKDTVVVVPIYTLNHDEKYFKNPESFDPDRFMGDRSSFKKSFLPFAAGPRNCIGMKYALLEIKSCIARIVLEYKFLPSSQTKVRVREKSQKILRF